jgi:hypothetical protein
MSGIPLANSAEPSSPKVPVADGPSATVRKIRALGLLTAVAVLFYTGTWFYASGWIKTWINNQIAVGKENGQSWTCPDLDIRGYPFRVGLYCRSVEMEDPASGLSLKAGKLQSAAQVYDPGHSIVELDGPLDLRTGNGVAIKATWDLAHASVIADVKGLIRYAMEMKGLTSEVSIADPVTEFTIATPDGQIHLRQNGSDLELAASLMNMSVVIPALPTAVPVFSFEADIALAGQAGLMAGERFTSLHNQTVTIRQLQIDAGTNGRIGISGPIQIDNDGLMSGAVSVTIDKVDALRATVTGLFPDVTDTANMIVPLLAGMAKPDGTVTLTLSISRGAVSLGLIPLGVIAPL